eukprot:2440536-Rhodomonas_salina.1
MSFSVNSQRLNKIICTCIPSTYDTIGKLELDAGETFHSALTTDPAQGDDRKLFNQSKYFQKDGNGIETSYFHINNIATTPAPLTLPEVFNADMEALNIAADMNNGLHAGCFDLNSWKKYYFCHIISLEHRNTGSDFYIQGYDARNSAVNCKWTCKKETGASGNVYPYVFAEHTKLMQINYGQQIAMIY